MSKRIEAGRQDQDQNRPYDFGVAIVEFVDILKGPYDKASLLDAYLNLEAQALNRIRTLELNREVNMPFYEAVDFLLDKYMFLYANTSMAEHIARENNDVTTADWFHEISEEFGQAADGIMMRGMHERFQKSIREPRSVAGTWIKT